jgi:hypothetical protein
VPFSYTPGGASDLDDIRAAIGDTQAAAPVTERLEDEEIARLLTIAGSKPAATVAAAKALIAKLSRRATEKDIGSLRLVYTQRIESLWKLVGSLEVAASGAVMPYLGGASISDRDAIESDTDRVQPAFKRGMFDNPRTS